MTHRDDLSRREALRRLTAAAVAPVAAGLTPIVRHPLVPALGRERWLPLVLDTHQTATVTALAEAIIPETDTPGATAALVHQFIDFDLSEAAEADRAAFLEGLARLDRASRQRYGGRFVDLPATSQIEMLSEMSAADPDDGRRTFFEDVKRRTVTGYYTSRVGLFEELGYRGNAFLQSFEGCTHAEHLRWEPEERQGR